MTRPTVLLADDHKIVTQGLQRLLEPSFDLVGTVENGRELISKATELQPDVIVADISMPMLNGIDAVRQLRKAGCKAKVIFLTMHPDVTYAARAFDAGASGFVLKHSAPGELITAIREALRGGTYVAPKIAKGLMQVMREGGRSKRDSWTKLTPRQREVLQLLAEGRSAKEAAAVLNISPRTAEFHKYRMMEALQIQTTAELIQFAVREGLVDVSE